MKNIISIDIGSKNLHMAEGSYDKGKLIVNKTDSYRVPEGSITKERVTNQAELGDAILYALKLCNYSDKNVTITMNAAEHTIIKELEFPKAKSKELSSMIHNEMIQVHNILATDIIQYKEIETNKEEDNNLNKYRIASISKDFVDDYYNTLKNVNLKPVNMDININAIDKMFTWAESFNGQEIKNDEAILLIDFGHSNTSVYIASKGRPLFYRHINMGLGKIDKILSGELFISPEEIEKIKQNENFFEQSMSESENNKYSELIPYFYNLNDEIRKILTFFRGRFRDIQVSRGYTFGNGSELKSFSEFWDLNLNLPIDQLHSIKGKNSQEINVNPAHINAISALIRN